MANQAPLLPFLFVFTMVLLGSIETGALTNDESLKSFCAERWKSPKLVLYAEDIVEFTR